jgi:hypothetical protein
MKNVALGFAYRPKAILAVFTTGVFPDQNRSGENSGAIVKADTAVTQRLGMPGLIPLELDLGVLRLKRTLRKQSPHGDRSIAVRIPSRPGAVRRHRRSPGGENLPRRLRQHVAGEVVPWVTPEGRPSCSRRMISTMAPVSLSFTRLWKAGPCGPFRGSPQRP